MIGRLVDWLLLIFGLVGLAGVTWWALYGGPTRAENLQNILQTEAETALIEGGHVWASVVVDGQSAILSGDSPSYDSVDAAVADVIAAVGEGGFLFGGITVVAEAAQAAQPISPYVWSATRDSEGIITLAGYVPSRAVMNSLLDDAEAMAPGEVRNELMLGTGEPYGDWSDVARQSLMFLDQMERGSVQLVDAGLTVSGVATNDQIRNALVRNVRSVEEPYSAKAEIRSAGIWRARHSDKGLILSGSVSSQAERNEINALANEYYLGRVRDNMIVRASNAGNWLSPIRFGLPHFARFQTGELAFVPSEGVVRFEGDATNSVLTYLNEDLSDVDTPWDIQLDVKEVAPILSELGPADGGRKDQAAVCQAAFEMVLSDNRIVFEAGSASLLRESGPALDHLLAIVRRCEGLDVQVQGHTDAYGDRAGNIRLSEQRAAAVVDYLAARGIARGALDAVGFGPDQPIATNDTADGRSANRRIEFRVLERG
ncbi:MAG: OmpA family protein [Pseudomonadota bacterium]